MKHSVLSLAIVAILIGGCSDGQLTDPLGHDTAGNGDFQKRVADGGDVIGVHTIIGDGSTAYEVVGIVKYTLTQVPILSEELFDLMLKPEIGVHMKKETYYVASGSNERVSLTRRSTLKLEKEYFLRGGPASINLNLQFEVSATSVSLVGVSIVR